MDWILFLFIHKKKSLGNLEMNFFKGARDHDVAGKSARECFLYDLDHWAYKMYNLLQALKSRSIISTNRDEFN